MNLNDLDGHLQNLVECVDFDKPTDRHWNTAPCGEQYVICKFEASKLLFADGEDVLCKMFLSRVIKDIRSIEFWEIDTNGTKWQGTIKLYWRTKPEIEDDGKGFVNFYARYLVVGERDK